MFEDDVVALTWAEMAAGANVGVARRLRAIFKEADPQEHDEKKGLWETDTVGALCEMSASMYFNLGWSGAVIGNSVPDVGWMLETRAVWDVDDRLIVRDSDVPKRHLPFLKVYAKDNKFKMCGWVFAREAMEGKKTDPTGKGRKPAWFVDNDKLHSMKSLRDWVSVNRPHVSN